MELDDLGCFGVILGIIFAPLIITGGLIFIIFKLLLSPIIEDCDLACLIIAILGTIASWGAVIINWIHG